MRGHVEVVRALVVAGADRGAVNKQGATPLDLTDPQVRCLGLTAVAGLAAGCLAQRAAPSPLRHQITHRPPPPLPPRCLRPAACQ
jgi:hypothetical protein